MDNLQKQAQASSHIPRVPFCSQSPDCCLVVNCSVYTFKTAIRNRFLFLILRWLSSDFAPHGSPCNLMVLGREIQLANYAPVQHTIL